MEPSLVFSSLSSPKRIVRHCRLALWQALQGRERQYRLALYIPLPTAELVCFTRRGGQARSVERAQQQATRPRSSPSSRNLGCDWRRDRPSSEAQFQHGLIPPPGLSPPHCPPHSSLAAPRKGAIVDKVSTQSIPQTMVEQKQSDRALQRSNRVVGKYEKGNREELVPIFGEGKGVDCTWILYSLPVLAQLCALKWGGVLCSL